MKASPLALEPGFQLGPIPISKPVIVTWCLMAALVLISALLTRRLSLSPRTGQSALELFVEALDEQIKDTLRADPAPYRALIGTIFIFVLLANWSSLIPGVEPPTARLETDTALAVIVFFATIYHGLRTRGVLGYLKTFAEPSVIMIPLNLAHRAPVRQYHERRVRRRDRPVRRGPARADTAHGARFAHRRGASLYLRDARDGVHRLGGRRA